MKQLTEDYVSYEIAVLLKEKGFKQDCDYATSWYAAKYYKNSAQGEWFEGEHEIIKDIDDKCTISYLSDEGVFIPAPTQSLTLKWLREVHKIFIEPFVAIDLNGEYHYCFRLLNSICKDILEPKDLVRIGFKDTYEEAVEVALLCVLKNLI